MPAKKIKVAFTVNGKAQSIETYPMSRLLDILRIDCKLTGAKEGCGEGECGACSIFIDGKLVTSCLVPMAQVEAKHLRTIEGLASPSGLHAVQAAFIKYGGAQCGICTPGMILAAMSLLERETHPSEKDVQEALAGNLCRCTGYTRIFEAVLHALQQEGKSP